jgi:diacylglycerol O-acyltransferase
MAIRSLSGLDAGFLYIETPEAPMHVGALALFAYPEVLSGALIDHVRAHLATRLHLSGVLSQRLALMPFDLGHPLWVNADDVDLTKHVRHARLPKPGSLQALNAMIAKLHAEPLDRSRPLWEFWIIEGLRDGSFALFTKVHHAALDGAAGVALAHALLDLGALPREVPPPSGREAKPPPGTRRKLGMLFSNTLAQYTKLAKALPGIAQMAASGAGKLRDAIKAPAGLADRWLAPRTRFNVAIDATRAVGTWSLPLAEFKSVAAMLGASVNDLLLTLCSGALRSYLKQNGELPKASLVAAIPVSLRAKGDGTANNQVTMLPCALGTQHAKIEARLAAVQAGMAELKETTVRYKSLIPTDYPSLGAPWIVAGLAQLYAKSKLAERVPLPVNLIISNVPGSPVTLYLAGARMLAYHPISAITHGLALNITVQSYEQALDFGVVACRSVVADVPVLIDSLAAEYDALKALAAAKLAPKSQGRRKTTAGTRKRSPRSRA